MKKLSGFLVAMFVGLPVAFGGTVLLSDNFDTENGGVTTINHDSFANWVVSDGSVDLIGPGLADVYPGNGLYLDLDGTTNDAGVLTSAETFSLLPGEYELRFDLGDVSFSLGQGGPNNMTVSLGNLYTETFETSDAMIDSLVPIVRTIDVTDPADAQLAFDHSGGDNFGIVIDNVSLTLIPEPATGLMAMLLFAACPLGRSHKRM